MSDFKIIGNPNPVVGVEEFYTVSNAISSVLPYQNTAPAGTANFELPVKWEVYVLENRRWRKTKENDKTGKKISYTFFQKSLTRNGIRILAKRGEETARLEIKTHTAQNPKIESIELLDKSGKKLTAPLSYGQTLKARVHCLDMEKRTVYATLWEEDLNGKTGHENANPRNIMETRSGTVKNGIADIDFLLKPSVGNIALMGNKTHTYYVTTDLKKDKISSNNIDVKDIDIPVAPYKGKTTPKEPAKKNAPVQQPKAETPKANKTEDSKAATGKITSVHLTDAAGNQLVDAAGKQKSVFKEKQIKVLIHSTGLVGKEIRLKLFDHDYGTPNDLLLDQNFIIKADHYAIVVSLDTIPRSKGGGNIVEGAEQELFADVQVVNTNIKGKSAIVDVDATVFKPDTVETTNKVAKVGGEDKKEKFEKVRGLGKEAILYITSEIASEIKIDRNGKIDSFPDYGGFNGMHEYIERGKIYCKKISNDKSAFPLYKMYVYRGNVKGQAIKKLKQDLHFKTYENAESTILTVARHTQSNNKNYNTKGPVPPNTLHSLYRVRYMRAWNHSGKESFRYRLVDDNISNLRPVEDLGLEVSSGAMTLKGRSSISIDPWKSKDLVGCLGIRNSDGTNHSSCGSEMGDLSASNYKFIYHALNNYLESVIPELTGVYGRRGYSSNGRIVVKESEYEEEIKVFALIDNLPELNDDKLFNLEDATRALRLIYDNYGKEIAKNVEMMYRWECSHFRSGQYKHCGGPGMEAANNNHPTYGWNGEMYNKFPQYTPVGIWEEFENKGMSGRGGNTQVTDHKKKYVQFPSVEAGMVYVAEFLVRHDGNVGRWHTTDVSRQSNYVTNINSTIPRIVNSF